MTADPGPSCPTPSKHRELMFQGKPLSVGYVTQWFPPEPGNVPLWIAKSLNRQGLELNVLTGVPNYPTGKTYAGYSPWKRTQENLEGFKVLRTPLFPSHGVSSLGRLANLASYAASSATLGAAAMRGNDVNLVYSSPATAALAAMRAKKRWKIPYVLLILDMWPDSVFASGFLANGIKRRISERVLHNFVNSSYKSAAQIAVTSPGMIPLLLSRGVPEEKLCLIYNWVDEQTIFPQPPDDSIRKQLDIGDGFMLMYAGNLGAAQALETVVEAMGTLRDLHDLHLVMIGDGSEKTALKGLASKLELQSVHFIDPVDAKRIPSLTASADIQLVSLAAKPLFDITMPSKIQSLMACGQPILLSGAGDAASVVRDADAGIVCPPQSPDALASAIRHVHSLPHKELQAMGQRGYEYYHRRMSEKTSSYALADALLKAAESKSR